MADKQIEILYVEDNPRDARPAREYFREADETQFELVVASRLSEALALLATRTYDLALLDLSLPNSQGLETFLALRQAAPTLPIVT